MTTTDLITTTDTVIVGVPMMDATEARAVVTRIKTHIDVARGELLELKDREGWRALGYRSWGACAKAEFGGSAATLYRQLEAAEIARDLGDSQFENLPTSHLQAVKDLPPDQARQALDQASAKANGQPTARDVWAEADRIAQRTPPEVTAAGVQLTKHGSWFKATGFSGVMNGWTSGDARPYDQTVAAAREEIAKRTAPPPPPAPTPDLTDILLRLDAHGYAKSGTRQKGITTFYSFRDYRSTLEDGQAGEIELAEGELPFWLAELDSNVAYAQAKQEKYLDAQGRAERLGYDLRRDGAQFVLTPAGMQAPAMRGTLDQMIKAVEGYERSVAKQAAAEPPLTIEQLDDCLPKGYEKLGYFWVTATPPTLGHIDGWRCDAPTIAQAISQAADREKAKAEPTPWNKIAQLSYKLGSATDRNAALDLWIAIGPLLEPPGVQQVVSSWKPDEIPAFETEADRALQTLDTYGYPQIASFVRQTYTLLLDKEPAPALAFTGQRQPAPVPASADWWNALRAIERAMQHKKLGDACAATFDLLRLISGTTPQTRAAALLIALEREMKDLTTDDQEGLSQAISDLNECVEGTEVKHWLGVGYALLDLEAE